MRKSRVEQMTFGVFDGSFLLGGRGTNVDCVTTHTGEVGHFATPPVGVGVFGSVNRRIRIWFGGPNFYLTSIGGTCRDLVRTT